MNTPGDRSVVPTGIEGLDDVLGGGLTPDRLYLVEGDPGAGKTTLALRFLLAGAERGEAGLYVTLSETKEELRSVAASHGWSLEAIHLCELVASEETLQADSQFTMFHPSEVELGETTRSVLDQVERLRPRLIVFDSLSEMRLLAQSPLRYRRQILALKQFFIGRGCTVLLLDDRTSETNDLQLQSIAHGVLTLEQLAPEYGAERRRLRVVKLRGQKYRGGYHDFIIERGGLRVFPRLVANEHHRDFNSGPLASGMAELDALLGGGIERGSSTLLLGPAGSGKSSLMTQYVVAAADRGERAALFTFEESFGTLLTRAERLGQGLRDHFGAGRVTIKRVDPAELSPGEFAHLIRAAVERDGARIVAIDSLNGYLNAMPEERFLIVQLREILTYLNQQGVTSLLVVAQHGLLGTQMQASIDASYLADTVILSRFFEARGEIRKAVSVVKKRSGQHEPSIRELTMRPEGLVVGPPLRQFQGILTGVPVIGEPSERPAAGGHA